MPLRLLAHIQGGRQYLLQMSCYRVRSNTVSAPFKKDIQALIGRCRSYITIREEEANLNTHSRASQGYSP